MNMLASVGFTDKAYQTMPVGQTSDETISQRAN